ncbi:hypothetical protein PRMUPPPA20_15830 [Xylanibacter ruminicola]|nr:hypothetical protein [Xylanibacter ruminicola]GJG33474.1 hypothetical protein PRMUPPPA20_15830 [Xylanibacter ruminicola]
MRQLKDAVKLLPGYIEDLKRGKCMEAFSISSGLHRKELFWLWCERICSDMEVESFYESLKCCIEELKTLLAEAEKALMHCDSAMFEKFYFAKKQNYSGDAISKRFEKWRYENLCVTIDKLRELQAKVVAESLTKGIMRFAPVPSQKELNEVQMDYLKGFLPYDFVMSDDFCVSCAQWRQFIHWNDTILIIDYKKYGKYIQNHYYDFSDTQLQAIFELDMKLYLIHKEMARLNPELINVLQPTETGQLEDTILFAPYNTITRMLQQDWFDAVSVDKEKYTATWRDELVSCLMKSEIGHVIAEEWQKTNKRPQLKAAVVGSLKKAGVIQGSDLGIASAIVGDDKKESKNFAIYMGMGKKGPIADWICNHVKD